LKFRSNENILLISSRYLLSAGHFVIKERKNQLNHLLVPGFHFIFHDLKLVANKMDNQFRFLVPGFHFIFHNLKLVANKMDNQFNEHVLHFNYIAFKP